MSKRFSEKQLAKICKKAEERTRFDIKETQQHAQHYYNRDHVKETNKMPNAKELRQRKIVASIIGVVLLIGVLSYVL